MRHSILYSSPLISFTHPTCLACLGWFRAAPYHASTSIIAQVIILFKGRRKCKYHMTFAKRVFMLFNVFYISRLLIIDQVSFTWHAQHLRLQMQIESRCRFFLSLSFFFYSFLFRYLFKGFFLPCFFNETSYFLFSVMYNFLLQSRACYVTIPTDASSLWLRAFVTGQNKHSDSLSWFLFG